MTDNLIQDGTNFPISISQIQNPYQEFTYTLAAGEQRRIDYSSDYFRVLDLTGTGLKVRFAFNGSETEWTGAGIGFKSPAVFSYVILRNTSGAPFTITVAMAIGFITDDRLNVSGNINVVTPPATALTVVSNPAAPLEVIQDAGTNFAVKNVNPSAFTTGQVSVGTSATLILAANTSNRALLTITAPATGDLFIGGAAVTVSTGIRVPAGSSYSTTNTAARYGVLAVAATVTYEEETF